MYIKVSSSNLSSYVVIDGIDPKNPNSLFLMRAIQDAWRLNVSRFFKRHESFYAPQAKFGLRQQKYDDIKTVFYCEIRGSKIIGIIDTTNAPYIKTLIHGARPDKGAYVPSLGARVNTGVWRGIPSIYWLTWESFFRSQVYLLVQQFGFTVSKRSRKKKSKRPGIGMVRAACIDQIRDAIDDSRGSYNGYI